MRFKLAIKYYYKHIKEKEKINYKRMKQPKYDTGVVTRAVN